MPVKRSRAAIVACPFAQRSGPRAVNVPFSTVCIPPFADWAGFKGAGTPALMAVLPQKGQGSARKGQ